MNMKNFHSQNNEIDEGKLQQQQQQTLHHTTEEISHMQCTHTQICAENSKKKATPTNAYTHSIAHCIQLTTNVDFFFIFGIEIL